MTLVRASYRPLVLVLPHLAGREEWPFSATKPFKLITLAANAVTEVTVRVCKPLQMNYLQSVKRTGMAGSIPPDRGHAEVCLAGEKEVLSSRPALRRHMPSLIARNMSLRFVGVHALLVVGIHGGGHVVVGVTVGNVRVRIRGSRVE